MSYNAIPILRALAETNGPTLWRPTLAQLDAKLLSILPKRGEGGVYISEVARHFGMTNNAAEDALKRLTKAGFANRLTRNLWIATT